VTFLWVTYDYVYTGPVATISDLKTINAAAIDIEILHCTWREVE
jgi:hypothetical protein